MGASNRSSENKVWYTLGTEGGEMKGKPLFKQWMRNKPSPPPPNLEELNGKYHLTFTDISGVVEAISIEDKVITYDGKTDNKKILHVIMSDEDGTMDVDLGSVDGRYAMNFLNRLLNKDLDISEPISIHPYRMVDDSDKLNMGMLVHQGKNKIMGMNKEALAEIGCTQAERSEFKGKVYWDFMPVATWLFARVRDKLQDAFVGGGGEPFASEELEMDVPTEPSKMEKAAPLYPPKGDSPNIPSFAKFTENPEEETDLPF